MKLKNAARYFDTCPVYDGYSDALLFKVQSSTFMEAASEGSVSVRRTISLDPSFSLPSHSVIKVLDEKYVTGEINTDEWTGSAIRKTCWTRKVSNFFNVRTPEQALANVGSVQLYGQKRQQKEVATLDSSNLENFWEASFSANAAISKGQILNASGTLYRVRFTYIDVDGFLTCGLDQLQYTVSRAVADTGKVYDPVLDTYTGSSTQVNGLPIDYKIVFDKKTQADYAVEQGDICVLLPDAVQPKTGLILSLAEPELEGKWVVLNALRELDCWNVHVRRV